MTSAIILIICVLLLIAYLFDISSVKTKIPTVIILLGLGWIVKETSLLFKINIPDLSPVLPILGTIGLILIVLEGSLELELNREKLPIIGKSLTIALFPMFLLSFGLAFAFHYSNGIDFKVSLTNAIPFAIISSAIAIPSANNLSPKNREFITYESSLSDIFGVIFFNFINRNNTFGIETFSFFTLNVVIIIIISFVATIGLTYILSNLKHHVKYTPIIIIIIFIYDIAKIYNLPALIPIFVFGLFLGNFHKIKYRKLINRLRPNILTKEVHKFKNLTNEISFLIRSLFFLLFGFLIDINDVINTETLVWAIGIVFSILVIRFAFLKLFKITTKPLIFMAPRGLITILLFLSIPTQNMIGIANKSLIIQVIILSSVIMMIGLILTSKEKKFIIETSEEEKIIENTRKEFEKEDKDVENYTLHN